jgi:hypothetical protein
MYANYSIFSRSAGFVAGALLTLTSAYAGEADAFPVFDNNYIQLSGQNASLTGDKAAFQTRTQNAKSGTYGIEAMRFGKDISKDTNLQFDGKVLAGIEDYLGKLTLTKNDVGTFETGYKRSRTFYDGVGGFFPTNQLWTPLANQMLHTDRGTMWVDGTIALPNMPVFHIRYNNEARTGMKDSTIMGDTDFSGVPISTSSALNPISANRKVMPAYYQLSERHENLVASITHTVANTLIDVRLIGDRVNNLDTRFFTRYPGELRPYPFSTSPTRFIDPSVQSSEIRVFDRQGVSTSSMSVIGKIETVVNEKVKVFAGVSHVSLDGDISGSRINTTVFATSIGNQYVTGGYNSLGGRSAYSYISNGGTIDSKITAINAGLEFKPVHDLHITASIKGEDLSTSASNPVTYYATYVAPATGAVTPVGPYVADNHSKIDERSWTPELSARYTGIKKVSLYSTLDYRHVPGSESSTYSSIGPVAGTTAQSLSTADSGAATKENHGHYTFGANWAPCTFVSLRGETFYKDHQNGFYDDGTTDRFIMGYTTYGTKISATVKPTQELSFTSRYIVQRSTLNTVKKGDPIHTTEALAVAYDSGDYRSYQFGETVDWNPVKQFYMQANVNVVFDTLKTAYPRAGGTGNDVLRNSDNSYVNGSVIAGFVVDKDTNAELQYCYYKADNYNPGQAYATVPYGFAAKEVSYSVAVKHKFTPKLFGSLKVGYFDSKNDTTGGNTNFKGTLVYATLTQAF